MLIKNAEALERFAKVDTLVVDKTGTLTEGKPKVTTLVLAEGTDEKALLRLAASLSGRASIRSRRRSSMRRRSGAAACRGEGVRSITGKGVRGRVDGREVAIGTQRLLDNLDIDPGPLAGRADRQRAEGETVMFVAVDGKAAGLIGVADPIKLSTPALEALRAAGLRLVMLTGDNRTTADVVARQVGIDEIHAEICPIRRRM